MTGRQMTRDEFLVALGELLETDSPLIGSEELTGLGSWDSVAVISFIGMVDDKWGATLAPTKIRACKTVDDLAALVT